MDNGKARWYPSEERIRESHLGKFLEQYQMSDLPALRERAFRDPEWFWDAVVKMIDWPFVTGYSKVIDQSQGMEWTNWFVGGKTNLALAALDRHVDNGYGDKRAIIEETESGKVRTWTYKELQEATDRLAYALQDLHVEEGDRVAIYLPMSSEAVMTMLACAKLGAIVVPIFSGYGAPAIATRLQDAEVKICITADGYTRRGRIVEMKVTADEALKDMSGIQVVVVSRLGIQVPWTQERDLRFEDLIASAPKKPFPTRIVSSDAPLLLIYTSGTTGKPKGALHVHTGFPLKATQDLWHAFDLKSQDIFFWYTDMGWMMGPWMVYGGLITGATIVLYDGTPDYPHAGRLWEMIDAHHVTVFGISPTVIRGLMGEGDAPLQGKDLSSLRVLGSSGEPWNVGPWNWFYEKIGHERCPIINYSGGTEISGGILSGFVTEPSKPAAFNGPIPGMVAEIWDSEGLPAKQQIGELVIRAPWPGMTRGFWKNDQRYIESYWQRFPKVWVHGDYAYIDDEGFWFISGRSDDTIKVAGKRVGPAEVESVLVSHPKVIEAAAIGVPDPVKGEALVCFVVSRGDLALDNELKDYVAHHMGKSLRPSAIYLVPELPKTRNGKVVRRAIRASFLGLPLGDVSSIENITVLRHVEVAGHVSPPERG